MRRLGYVLVLMLALGAAGLAIFQSVLHGERSAFERRVERLREAGELVGLEPIYGAVIPERDDARPLLEAIVANALPILRSVDITPEEGSDEERELAGRLEPFLRDLDGALARPRCSFPAMETGGGVIVTDFDFFRVTHLIRASAAGPGGPYAAAKRALRWVRLLEGRSWSMAAHRTAIFTGACEHIRSAAQRPGFDAHAARAELDGPLRAFEAAMDLGAVYRVERGFMIHEIERWSATGEKPNRSFHGSPGWVESLTETPLWGPVLFRDANRTLDLWADVLENATNVSAATLARLERLGADTESLPDAHIITREAQSLPAHVARYLLVAAATSRRTRVALGLWDYRADHGAYPDALNELSFDDGVPQDPIGECAFEYEVTDAGVRLAGKTWPRYETWFREWVLPAS